LIIFAGVPATTVLLGISLVTTLPAPITTLSPIEMYKLAYYCIPKQNSGFIKYIKKKEKKKKEDKIINDNSITKIDIFDL